MRQKMKKIIFIFLLIIGLCGIGYYTYEVILWKKDVDSNHEIIEQIEDTIKIIEEPQENDLVKYQIDFSKLKEENQDVVAYLIVQGTSISYPVVKTSDNDYYLNHNLRKEKNVAGWIFMDFHNKFDGEDKNMVIYGHNTSDGSMFGTLKNILKEEWYKNEDNLAITLITEREEVTYSVFSIYSIIPEDYYINTEFKSNNEYEEFLQKINSRSLYNFQIDLDKDDQILTLSSCMQSGMKRIVLHAKKINSIKKTP